MILGKPLQIMEQRKNANVQPITGSDAEVGGRSNGQAAGHGGGSISNTFYFLCILTFLLAHAQLAEVLWNMVLSIGHKQVDWLRCVIQNSAIAFWGILTVGILLLMEWFIRILHTLRLHWFEFQSKFYQGQGYGNGNATSATE